MDFNFEKKTEVILKRYIYFFMNHFEGEGGTPDGNILLKSRRKFIKTNVLR